MVTKIPVFCLFHSMLRIVQEQFMYSQTRIKETHRAVTMSFFIRVSFIRVRLYYIQNVDTDTFAYMYFSLFAYM